MIKLLFVIIAVVIVGVFITLGNNKPNQSVSQPITTSTSQNNQGSESVAIERIDLTSTGFMPKYITVKVGTTVIWVNKSGKISTISSDLHPTHLVYPDLNIGEFDDGSAIQFVFDKKGEYGYHNHYNPNAKGTVKVE